jgi:membrane protein implicated in regulation of membrane protease activity
MRIKERIIKICIRIISVFISIVVPFSCLVVPFVCAISDTLWFLLFYIVTIPLALIWYSFMPKAWKETREYIIEELRDASSKNAEDVSKKH